MPRPGTIEMGGFSTITAAIEWMERHATLNLGNCIGACLEYASRVNKPVMIYVFSDGSLASSGMIEQFGGRTRQGRVDGGQPKCRCHVLPGFQSCRQTRARPAQPGDELADRHNFNPDGSLNTTRQPRRQQNVPNLVADGGC